MIKETNEMLEQLKTADSLNGYLQDNGEHLIDSTISTQLAAALAESGMTKSDVLRRAEINDIYGYQLFSGVRKPSRDKLIALSIGMTLTLDRTQQLLKATGFAPLYAKNKRDSILIFGIQNGQTVFEINSALFEHEESTL